MSPPEAAAPIVVVIDDDGAIRESVGSLLESMGLETESYPTVRDFHLRTSPRAPACMVLDVRLPGQSGLDFYEEVMKSSFSVPVIFISGYADVPMSVRAMKTGAFEFLTKPVRGQELLDAVQKAIARGGSSDELPPVGTLRQAFETLTQREREVMAGVTAGRMNKEIAAHIGLSEATVKLHRGQVMRKMGATSFAQLVLMAEKLRAARR